MVTVLTTRLPRSPVISRPEEAAADTAAERRMLRMLTILLSADVFLQRFAIPVGETRVSLLLPIVLVLTIVMIAQGDLIVNVGRTRAYLIAMSVCTGVAMVVFLRHMDDTALTSLLLLLVTYLPFCVGLRSTSAAKLLPRVLDRFIIMTAVIAGLAILQFMMQVAGWRYTDVVRDTVPPDFLMKGFSTSYPVRYGSDLYKSNAFVCLEPSFCSQFLAMGIIATVLRRGKLWLHALHGLALVSTVSGTGVLLLAVGILLLAIHRGPRFATAAATVVAAAIFVISLTPASQIFAERATEVSSDDSSGSLRFVQPYERTWERLGSEDAATVLFGSGPGWAERDARDFLERTGLPLNYAMPPKVVIEYGVLGAFAFFYFVGSAFVRGNRSFVLAGSVVCFYTILSGGLLGSVVVYLAMLLVTWLSRDVADSVPAPSHDTDTWVYEAAAHRG